MCWPPGLREEHTIYRLGHDESPRSVARPDARGDGQWPLDKDHQPSGRSPERRRAENASSAQHRQPDLDRGDDGAGVGLTAHWCTLVVSVILDGLPMHPRCRWVTAQLA